MVAAVVHSASRLAKFLAGCAARHFRARPEIAPTLRPDQRPGLERYCPHKPWPKQAAFLALDCEEAFFGGGAGGGKSDVLLMAALQYVHVPNYHALILRRNYSLLSKAGAIMQRAKEWLFHTDAKWNEQRKEFTFPNGALLQFGFIERSIDWMNFLGTDYQFIGWDELTEFPLKDDDENNPYLCMFRSLRRNNDMPVPRRVRATSNPGHVGHNFVKRRFITDEIRAALRNGVDKIFDAPEGRKFVPSLAQDNPTLNYEEYVQSLMHLPKVTRERQLNGDWDISVSLQIPEEWLARYRTQGEHLILPDNTTIDQRFCIRFATIDTAGTSRDKAEESRGKTASWSVVAVWDYWPARNKLFLRHVWRDRVGWNELKVRVAETLRQWGVAVVRIENAHVGPPLASELSGFQVEMVGPMLPGMADGYRGAKLERAIASGSLARLEGGGLLIPADSIAPPWVGPYVQEVTSWSGSADEPTDQIDVTSYAAWHVKRSAGGPIHFER